MKAPRWVAAVVSGAALVAGTMLPATSRGGQESNGVQVETVRIAVPGQTAMTAFVVRPDGRRGNGHRFAGVLYLHWFEPGHASADSSEFLAEAIELADRGVVSVLPQQRFPWAFDPVGDQRDRTAVSNGVADARAALDYLARQEGVDRSRLAIAGHDYGAMYATVLAQADRRVKATVLVALDARWANWFNMFWIGLEGPAEAAYFAVFAGLDPVDNVSRLGARQLFQWSDPDFFIPAAIRAQFAAAAPNAIVKTYTRTDHSLDLTTTESNRIAFLATQLGL
ncbi:MAG TPA: prolyl oligopeptidase family serine peptidase [Kribbellaceae bacterium]|nr:prolyl oligopeptidase family serine peptidase [Kribbellaceae bacterium]